MPNITEMRCKQACSKVGKSSPDPWNLNLYRGCMHKCIYCFAIYSHKYLQESGNYFDDIYVKVNIAEQLDKQLSHPSWKGEVIGISGVTDCYQPLEAKYKLMPEILKVLIKHKNPCSISTKSDLILRDYELIDELSRVARISINASISCSDNEIRKKIEPGAKNAAKKFNMLKELSMTNAITGILQMPIIPYITDGRDNIEQLYANAVDSKVDYIVPGVLYLRGKTKGVFFDAVKNKFPELLSPLMQLYRSGSADKAYKNSLYQMVSELKRKYRLSSYTKILPKKKIQKNSTKAPIQLTLFDVNLPKRHEPSPIPTRVQLTANPPSKKTPIAVAEEDLASFVEIEMDSLKSSHTPASVQMPQVQPVDTVINKKRALFYSMRQIARNTSMYADHSKIFYEQAIFMKDFEDDYPESTSFSSYFPYYQRMGYEQLRTYFTWRTNVRNSEITATSTSYAFLYIYELLNQIGVDDPEDGLDKLVTFWQHFRSYEKAVDRYVLQWIKDYHIYYPLPHSFREFVDKHQLFMHYPTVFGYESARQESFDIFASISKYNIKKSIFYKDETHKMINDCFYFVLKRFREYFKTQKLCFEDLIFSPIAKVLTWIPFNRALFYQVAKQSERSVIISKKEVYNYKENRWRYKSVRLSDQGRQLVGYIMKEMECSLRKIVKFKYKLTANPKVCDEKTRSIFTRMGIPITDFIQTCVQEFYQEITRTPVSVDTRNLPQIRKVALQTQEKLIVPDSDELVQQEDKIEQEITNIITLSPLNIWARFKESLTEVELQALDIILADEDIKKFATSKVVMLEVLVDGINQKAVDYVGDTVLELDWDGSIIVYDEYRKALMDLRKKEE